MSFTSDTAYLTPQQYRNAKSRLTRAKNTKDAAKVIAAVDETFAEWDAGNFAYPDDWHRWENARMDANMALAHGIPMR